MPIVDENMHRENEREKERGENGSAGNRQEREISGGETLTRPFREMM